MRPIALGLAGKWIGCSQLAKRRGGTHDGVHTPPKPMLKCILKSNLKLTDGGASAFEYCVAGRDQGTRILKTEIFHQGAPIGYY
jgi:hypothetical protein